jgi:hypothetical protein
VILNIRGTSGSGKSTLVRNIMDLYWPPMKVRVPDRKRPLMYICPRPPAPTWEAEVTPTSVGSGPRSLAVIGHYETACGGCDTIPDLDMVYALVRQAHDNGYDVLFEGLLLSAEVNRCVQLAAYVGHENLAVIALDVPLELCLESVNARRHTKNPEKPPVNPKNTISKHRGTQTSARRLLEAGVDTRVCHERDEALAIARAVLRA